MTDTKQILLKISKALILSGVWGLAADNVFDRIWIGVGIGVVVLVYSFLREQFK